MLRMNVYHFLSKNVRGEGEKRNVNLTPTSSKQEKRDFDLFRNSSQFSMADLFGDIRYNIKKAGDKGRLSIILDCRSKTQWLVGSTTTLISSALQPYSTVRRWDDESNSARITDFLSHSLYL